MTTPPTKEPKMSFFKEDRFAQFTDANPSADANGRTLCIAKAHIVAVYRQEKDHNLTNVFTVDGKAYTVKEDIKTVYKLID